MKDFSYTVTLHPNRETIDRIVSLYSDSKKDNDSPYIEFFASLEGLSVTVYKPNKKGEVSVVFQGPEALAEARLFDVNAEPASTKVAKPAPKSVYPQIGSDEVGTGDVFGPVVVCAAYVTKKDLALLKELGVTDSKLLTDEKIREIGKVLVQKFDYSLLVLMPEKFNEVVEDNNMNKIKARMHNRAIQNLLKAHPKAEVYLDQFCEEEVYYNYLRHEPSVVSSINFSTKGELHYVSVALGSVIARYAFLEKMDELSSELGKEIPFGAGSNVDSFLKELLKEKSKEELKKFAKLSFANFRKI